MTRARSYELDPVTEVTRAARTYSQLEPGRARNRAARTITNAAPEVIGAAHERMSSAVEYLRRRGDRARARRWAAGALALAELRPAVLEQLRSPTAAEDGGPASSREPVVPAPDTREGWPSLDAGRPTGDGGPSSGAEVRDNALPVTIATDTPGRTDP